MKLGWPEYNALLDRNFTCRNQLSDYAIRLSSSSCIFCTSQKVDSSLSRKSHFLSLETRFLSIFRSKFCPTTTTRCSPESGTSFYTKLARFECFDQKLWSKYWVLMKLGWPEYNALLDRNFTCRNQLSDYAIRLSSSSCIFCTSQKVDSSLSRKSHFLSLETRFLSIFRSKFCPTTTTRCSPESGTSFYTKLARFECFDQKLWSKYWVLMKLGWPEYNALLDRNFTCRNQLSDYAIRLSSSSCIFCTSQKVDSSLSRKSHFLSLETRFLSIFRSKFCPTTTTRCSPESGTSFYTKLARFECFDQKLWSKYWVLMKLGWPEYNALLDRNFTCRNQLSDYAIRLSSSSCIFCTSQKVDSSLSRKSHFLSLETRFLSIFRSKFCPTTTTRCSPESGTSFYTKLARFECFDQKLWSKYWVLMKLGWPEYNALLDRNFTCRNQLSDYAIRLSSSSCIFCTSQKVDSSLSRKSHFLSLETRFLSIFRSKFCPTTTTRCSPESGTSFYTKLARFECFDQKLWSKYWVLMKLGWPEYNALLDRNFTCRNQLSDYAIRLSSSSCIFCTSQKVDSSLSRKSHFLSLETRFLSIFRSKFCPTTTTRCSPESGTSFYTKLARFECFDQKLWSKYWVLMKLGWPEYNALLDRNFTCRNQLSDYAIRLSSSSCIFCTSQKVDSSLSRKSHFLSLETRFLSIFRSKFCPTTTTRCSPESGTSFYTKLARFECFDQKLWSKYWVLMKLGDQSIMHYSTEILLVAINFLTMPFDSARRAASFALVRKLIRACLGKVTFWALKQGFSLFFDRNSVLRRRHVVPPSRARLSTPS